MEISGADWVDVLVDWALGQIWEYVSTIALYVYPLITRTKNTSEEPLLTIDGFTAGWGVRNLLGVIYLQVYWLVTSAGELSRCKYCERIISYAPPLPVEKGRKARKPRSDREFCDKRCRQNYHYQHRVKPARQRGRA